MRSGNVRPQLCRQAEQPRQNRLPCPALENAEKLPALGLCLGSLGGVLAWWAMPGLEESPGSAAPPSSLRAALKAATCLTRILRNKN